MQPPVSRRTAIKEWWRRMGDAVSPPPRRRGPSVSRVGDEERRSRTIRGRLSRRFYPPLFPLVVGEVVAPAVAIFSMTMTVLYGTTDRLFGFVPVFWAGAFFIPLAVSGIIALRARPFLYVAVSVIELGSALTLLINGPQTDFFPPATTLLASALHGSVWVVYLCCHIVTETLSALVEEGDHVAR